MALDNFVSIFSTFVWELPRLPTAQYDPLPFVIPDASLERCYSTSERNFWFINLKMCQDDTMLCSLPISLPKHLWWTKLICSPKLNTRSKSWPTNARLLEWEASMPKLPPFLSAEISSEILQIIL